VTSYFNFAVKYHPHFEKRNKLGEDAYVAENRFICACDGVGGWIRKLVETGDFSREFAVNIR
jgi:protein phosphatase PTC7